MEDIDERTSLVRSNGANGAHASSHHNGSLHPGGQDPSRPAVGGRYTSTASTSTPPPLRDRRSLLAEIQRNLSPFQAWAANVIHEGDQSSKTLLNWVQSTRIARTFLLAVNILLTVLAFALMGIEAIEMVVREPIFTFLTPNDETTVIAAGLLIIVGAFGFAVAYNLLVEETETLETKKHDRDTNHRGAGGGGGGGHGGRDPSGPPPMVPPSNGQRLGSPRPEATTTGGAGTVVQRKTRVLFTTASTKLLIANTVVLLAALLMDVDLNSAWTNAYRHHKQFILKYEQEHHCCGFAHVDDRPIPNDKDRTCATELQYNVPCRDGFGDGYRRWQRGIYQFMALELTILCALLLVTAILATTGVAARKGWMPSHHKVNRLPSEDEDGQEEVVHRHHPTVALYANRSLEGAPAGAGEADDQAPVLIDLTPEADRPVVQPSLV
ncbi:hypothetical protein BGZ73_006209 [Actinomortierella ambigua]|nr:hypothetical protein BGZ73_006209 [Actinomortierella ambigua]